MICKECGKEFEGKGRKLYCSTKCGIKFRWRRHYQLNPEKYRLKRIKENSFVEKRILTRVKSRAKRLNIPFNLELADIIIPTHCPVLGLKIQTGQGYNPVNSPSLDRINPKGGYIKDNIRVISNRANLLKSNATVEEMRLVLKDLENEKIVVRHRG